MSDYIGEKSSAAQTSPMFVALTNQLADALKSQTEAISGVRMQASMLHEFEPAEESELKDRDAKKADSSTIFARLQDVLRQVNHNTAAVNNLRNHLKRLV